MRATHRYPDPSDPHPVFMFGEIDLDAKDPGSPAAFGEALLRVRRMAGPDRGPAQPRPRRPDGTGVARSHSKRHH